MWQTHTMSSFNIACGKGTVSIQKHIQQATPKPLRVVFTNCLHELYVDCENQRYENSISNVFHRQTLWANERGLRGQVPKHPGLYSLFCIRSTSWLSKRRHIQAAGVAVNSVEAISRPNFYLRWIASACRIAISSFSWWFSRWASCTKDFNSWTCWSNRDRCWSMLSFTASAVFWTKHSVSCIVNETLRLQ